MKVFSDSVVDMQPQNQPKTPFRRHEKYKLSFLEKISSESWKVGKVSSSDTNWRCHFIVSTNVLSQTFHLDEATSRSKKFSTPTRKMFNPVEILMNRLSCEAIRKFLSSVKHLDIPQSIIRFIEKSSPWKINIFRLLKFPPPWCKRNFKNE